jgi:glycosyltransferase involved in cell wall biosynthesis
MKISVIVTTYNRPDALKKVLDGLLAQSCLPHEIIVADDGSGSETKQMLVPYLARKNPIIKHVWQPDNGFRLAQIRNRGIIECRGDYLVILDGDCIPEKHFLADHHDLAERGAFFQGKRVLVNEHAADQFDHMDIASLTKVLRLALLSRISNRHHIVRIPFFPSRKKTGLSGLRGCNMGIFKKDAEAVNGFNHEFIGWGREDAEFVTRLYKYGLKRKENPFRAICYHLWHNENPRDRLAGNDALLAHCRNRDDYFCTHGLDSLDVADSGGIIRQEEKACD